MLALLVQDRGINAACDKAVYRIDVGLSKGCGNGHPEVNPLDSWLGALQQGLAHLPPAIAGARDCE